MDEWTDGRMCWRTGTLVKGEIDGGGRRKSVFRMERQMSNDKGTDGHWN